MAVHDFKPEGHAVVFIHPGFCICAICTAVDINKQGIILPAGKHDILFSQKSEFLICNMSTYIIIDAVHLLLCPAFYKVLYNIWRSHRVVEDNTSYILNRIWSFFGILCSQCIIIEDFYKDRNDVSGIVFKLRMIQGHLVSFRMEDIPANDLHVHILPKGLEQKVDSIVSLDHLHAPVINIAYIGCRIAAEYTIDLNGIIKAVVLCVCYCCQHQTDCEGSQGLYGFLYCFHDILGFEF